MSGGRVADQRLSIGLICHSSFGGSVRIAVDLASELAGRGHNVHLFAKAPPTVTSFGSGVRFWGCGTDVGPSDRLDVAWKAEDLQMMVRNVVSVVEREGLDILHFHYAFPFAWVAHEVARLLLERSPRIVATLHGTDVSVHGMDPSKSATLRLQLSKMDAVTTVSHAHAALAKRNLGLDRRPMVIHNFIDVKRFHPRAASSPPPSRRPKIAHLSNFRRVKNPQMVARVFAAVRREMDAELWLLGDGEGMRSTRRILQREGVETDVRCFGLRRDVEDILPECDVLLLASRAESFSLAALEAAACGVPVLAPLLGGLPEVIRDGETGLLFAPGDVDSAVRAALRLLQDHRLRSEMAGAAVTWSRRFSHEAVIPRYEALYRRTISHPRPDEVADPSFIEAGARVG